MIGVKNTMNNIVGLDWDNISLKTARKRQNKIEQNEQVSTLLYRTRNGFHLEIIFKIPLLVTENFRLREKYWDCLRRLEYSKRRYLLTGNGFDILFNYKKGHWRKMI